MAGAKTPKVRKAEAEAGPASAKKVKVSKTHAGKQPAKKTKKGTKGQDKQAETETADTGDDDFDQNTPFAWETCADGDTAQRLQIKEEAIGRSLHHAGRIEPTLRSIAASLDEDSKKSIQNWLAQLNDVKKKHSEFRVFIGFAGVTGAGKTSAINSIIGYRDLLPSSNEAAATAVPCLVAYNDDPDKEKQFRAEISFRSESDIRAMLDNYFEDLALLNQIPEGAGQDDTDTDDGALPEHQSRKSNMLHDLETVEGDTQELLEMVSAVFGLDETQLNAESTDSLFAKNPDVLPLLGQTTTLTEKDHEAFSERIKPYMDSVAAAHGTSGVEFAAWPLIKEVKIFIPSPVLKNGIVLVDLPGLADNIESRASVAQNYFAKLSVTAIVTPIIRACNEQTAVSLMTNNQQYCLAMDGKLHKKSFCVILSKMDDINVATYLKQHNAEARSDKAIEICRSQLQSLDEEFKKLDKEIATHKKFSKSTTGANAEDVAQFQKMKSELETRIQQNRKSAKHLNGRILHWCIQSRNSLVKAEIQHDFMRRQKRLLAVGMRQDDIYDGTVNIFPISSTAYWNVQQDSEKPVGFPAEEYTGLPALNDWLRSATVADRERHLDSLLNGLHGLFNLMKTWSCGQNHLSLTKDFVSREVLQQPLVKLQGTLNPAFSRVCKMIKSFDPMKNKQSTVAHCRDRCIAVVQHWSARDADNILCKAKMHWNTYNACIKRSGGAYRAFSPGRPRYAWIESLCNLFYEGIVKDWNLALNQQIPDLEAPLRREIDKIWDDFMQRLEKKIQVTAPEMRLLLETERASLKQLKQQLKDMVKYQFKEISVEAAKAHRSIIKSVTGKWEPSFKKARVEKGKGMFTRQQLILVQNAHRRGANMFKESTDDVDTQLRKQLQSLSPKFHKITETVLMRVRDLVGLMMDGATKGKDGDVILYTEPGSKEAAQSAVRLVVSEWTAHWRIGDYDRIKATDTAIPEYYHDDSDDEDGSADGEKVEEHEFSAFMKKAKEESD